MCKKISEEKMASNAFLSEIIGLLIFLGFLCISDAGKGIPDKFYDAQNKFYDVRRYGAVPDGKTDNSQVSRKEICS